MIRSAIAILWIKANGAELSESVYKVLSAGEIIHNASLLHDDVIDDAEQRREEKTFTIKFTPKISILAGDYLVSYAIEKLNSLNNHSIVSNFKDCIKNMAQAEIRQYFLRNSEPDIDTYIEICEGKTASLFSTIMENSAVLAKLPSDEAKTIGKIFGILFQIKNDLNEESAKNDKHNGIMTAKDIIGIENTLILSDNYRGKLNKIVSDIPSNKYRKALEGLINEI